MAKVLVVDDRALNVELMAAYLSELDVEVVSALEGTSALAMVKSEQPDLVLLDVMMPGLDGFEVCRRIKADPPSRLLPVVMVTALNQTSDRVNALEAGADDFIAKPVDRIELVARIRSLLRLKETFDRLDGAERVIIALARVVEAKDRHTESHTERVGVFSRRLGHAAGVRGQILEDLYLGGVIHDIGKIGIPDSILLKAGPLSAEEAEVMRTHVQLGEDIIRPLRFAASLLSIVRHHHERIDGAGYPDALRGDGIPLGARIVSIWDAYDAITADRPYRGRLSEDCAADILAQGSGSAWDAELVGLFLEMVAATRQRAESA